MELVVLSNQMEQVEGISAEYPYIVNRVSTGDTYVPWHWHEEVEFNYVLSGRLRVSIPGHSYVFSEGQGFYINTNILHIMEPADAGRDTLWDAHMIHPMLLSGNYRSIFDTKYMSPILKNRNCELTEFRGETENQRKILEYLRQAWTLQADPYREFRIRILFSEVWLLLMQELAELERNAKLAKPVSQERIQTMLSFIHQHYAEKLTLEQIAASAIVSSRECLRCFQSCIRKTPMEYLMDYRIQVAQRLLRTTSLPITEVALQAGFGSGAYFTKVFRQLRGLTPGDYRRSAQSLAR